MIAEFYLLFWVGEDAGAVLIYADADCFPVVTAEITDLGDDQYAIGDLEAGWAVNDTAWWQTRMLNMLGIQMPAEVDRGRRLVRLFLGALLSRQTGDERGYRYT